MVLYCSVGGRHPPTGEHDENIFSGTSSARRCGHRPALHSRDGDSGQRWSTRPAASTYGGCLALSATAGAVLARGANDRLLPAVVVAAATALISARIGHDIRAAASKRAHLTAAAVAENAVAIGLAAAASQS